MRLETASRRGSASRHHVTGQRYVTAYIALKRNFTTLRLTYDTSRPSVVSRLSVTLLHPWQILERLDYMYAPTRGSDSLN